MMYLFDDNSHNQLQENYFGDYIRILAELNNIIKWIHKPDTSLEDELEAAEAVFIHDSFAENVSFSDSVESNYTNWIIKIAKKNNIPLVIFSNSFTSTIITSKTHILAIKKDRFYRNFKAFLENYQLKEEVNLAILHSGTHYNVEKAKQLNDFFAKFILNNKSKEFDYEEVIKNASLQYKNLKELFHLAFPNKNIDLFEDELEVDNINSWENFNKKIKEMVSLVKSNKR